MWFMRIAGLLVGVWLLLGSAQRADACGTWSMNDKEKGTQITFWINSAIIKKGERRRGAIYLMEHEQGLRVVKGRKVVMRIDGDKLLKRGAVVGTVDDSGVTLGKKRFDIILDNPGTIHEQPSWSLTVKRGDKVILDGTNVWALCFGRPDAPKVPSELQAEIRRRVIYYVAWRELGL